MPPIDPVGSADHGQAPSLPVLSTKLHRPPVPDDMVTRDRLIARLNAATVNSAVLVSAPAGYGKSTLVSQWVETRGGARAWVSLDSTESELLEFLRYLTASIEEALPGAFPGTRDLLGAAGEVPQSVLRRTFLNELAWISTPITIVLDDYHRIETTSSAHLLLREFLERPSGEVLLVLVTRRDPPLHIAALRGSGRLIEIRLEDLRFLDSEVKNYLEGVCGTQISPEAVARFSGHTEGWAVGIRMAALRICQAENAEQAVQALTGSIVQSKQFLLEQVIGALSEDAQQFLLSTSIADRLCRDLCVALADGSGIGSPQELLDNIRRQNLFVIPLDDEEKWWRYHHLFQTLLQEGLRRKHGPKRVARLHEIASAWFESRGLIDEALNHALASGDADRVVTIISAHWMAEAEADRWYNLPRWLDSVPAELRRSSVDLSVVELYVCFFRQHWDAIPPILERLESLGESSPLPPTAVAHMQLHNAMHLYWSEEVEASLQLFEQRLPDELATPGIIEGHRQLYVGLAQSALGCGAQELQVIERLMAENPRASVTMQVLLLGTAVFVHMLGGDMAPVPALSGRMRAVVGESGFASLRGWGHSFEGYYQLHRMELGAAVEMMAAATREPYLVEIKPCVDASVALAVAHQLNGDPASADEVSHRLMEFALESNDTDALAVSRSCRVRLDLLQGDLTGVADWIQSAPEDAGLPDLFMWFEVAAITRARALVVMGTQEDLASAHASLEALRATASRLHLVGQQIEIGVLDALCLDRMGRPAEAVAVLAATVALAQPGGWVRPFVEAGPSIAPLLESLAVSESASEYLARLREAVPVAEAVAAEAVSQRSPIASPADVTEEELVEELTQREQDVLELLSRRLQNQEIAEHLFISTHTVNDHLKHIYEKLGVHNRRQAVRRAAAVGLLSGRHTR